MVASIVSRRRSHLSIAISNASSKVRDAYASSSNFLRFLITKLFAFAHYDRIKVHIALYLDTAPYSEAFKL